MAYRTCVVCGQAIPDRAGRSQTRCPDHRRVHDRTRRGTTTQRGLGADHRAIVDEVLVRDAYTCRLQLPGCTILATTGDHVIPRSKGGATTMENMVAACASCNRRKKDRIVPIVELEAGE